MKTTSNKNSHRLSANSSTSFDDDIPFYLQPLTILDIQLGLDSTDLRFSKSFVCSLCHEGDYANCTKRAFRSRWANTLGGATASSSFSNQSVYETHAIESPCKQILDCLRRLGESALEKMDLRFNISLTLTGLGLIDIKQRMWLGSLESLSKRYQYWLLSKFKKNLITLLKDPRMEKYSREKLACLQIYCSLSKIKFRSLKFSSNIPPLMVFRNSKKRRAMLMRSQRKFLKYGKKGPVKVYNEETKEYARKRRAKAKPINQKPEKREAAGAKPKPTPCNKDSLGTVYEKKHVIYRKSDKTARRTEVQEEALGRKKNRAEERLAYQDYLNDEEDSHYAPSHILSKQEMPREEPRTTEKYPEIVNEGAIRVDDKSNASSFVDQQKSWIRPKPEEINLIESKFREDVAHAQIEIEIESEEKNSLKLNDRPDNEKPNENDLEIEEEKENPRIISVSRSKMRMQERRTDEVLCKRGKDDMCEVEKGLIESSAKTKYKSGDERMSKYKRVSSAVQDLIGDLESYKKRLAGVPGRKGWIESNVDSRVRVDFTALVTQRCPRENCSFKKGQRIHFRADSY